MPTGCYPFANDKPTPVMKKLFLLLTISAFAWPLWAHPILSGIVSDAESGKPLPGALILLENTSQYQIANELGYFSFERLEPDSFNLIVTHIGYETIKKRVAGSEQVQRFAMQAAYTKLPTVEIKPELRDNRQMINQVDIQSRPIRNAQEVLRIVPGLFIAQHAGGGKAEQIFLRGFDIDHGTDVALSVDGMPANMVSHAHGQGYADLHFLIPELIEGVEYQKGPYQASIGNFSTAGAVSFQTQDVLSRNFLKLEGGQFNTYRAVAGLRLLGDDESSPRQAYVASSYELSDGYFESSQNFYRFNALAKYQNKVSETETVRFSLSTFASEWDASGQIPERAVEQGLISRFGAIDDTEGGNTSRTNINLEYLNLLAPNTFLKTQAYYSQYQFELYSNFTFFDRDPVNGDQIRQQEGRHLLGVNSSLQHQHNVLGLRAESEVGLQFRFDAVQDNELSYTRNRSTTLQRVALGDVRELNVGAYATETLRLTDKLQLNAGLRLDAFRFQYEDETEEQYQPRSQSKQILSPKLSLYYRLTPKLQFNLQSGMSFHSNDTRVVIAQEGQEILPRAYGIELNAITKPLPNLLLEAGFWRLGLEQEFVYVGDEGIVEPSGRTQRLGLDVSARYQPRPWLQMDVDANYAMPRSKEAPEGENYIPLAPTFTSTGGLELIAKNGWRGGLRYRYLEDRPANEDNSLIADGYFLLDAVLSYRLPSLEIGISAQNLLDTEWKEAQFETTSRLPGETEAVTEIHYTPGSPLFVKGSVAFYF